MSGLDDLLGAAFDFVAAAGGGAELICEGVAVPCVPAAQATTREQRDSGYWTKGTVVVELKRSDFELLPLTDRKLVTFGNKRRKVKAVDDEDPTDSLVRLTLELAP